MRSHNAIGAVYAVYINEIVSSVRTIPSSAKLQDKTTNAVFYCYNAVPEIGECSARRHRRLKHEETL